MPEQLTMQREETAKQSLEAALEKNGFSFKRDDLDDPKRLAEMNSEEAAAALGVDYNDEAAIEWLRDAGVDTLFNQFVGEAYVEWIKSLEAVELFEAGDWHEVDSTLENIDQIGVISAIMADDISYQRGFAMHVLIPNNVPYVLKLVRGNEASQHAFRKSLEHLTTARQILSEDFFLSKPFNTQKQIVRPW